MIRLEQISKYYHSSNAVVPALRKIKLEFNIGEFVVITGESGSGKSTLLNIISGMDTYDDGELYIDNEETSHYDDSDWEKYRKNRIGFVYQNHNLVEHYSVLNNVESTLLIQGYSGKEAKKKAKELIRRVGLGDKLYSVASKLSGGQKQRLSIARALAKNTDIIIADEPTGNLDSETGSQIMKLFGELTKEKLIIVVTHNYEEAAPYATRRVRLHDGEVVADQAIDRPVADIHIISKRDEASGTEVGRKAGKKAGAETGKVKEASKNIKKSTLANDKKNNQRTSKAHQREHSAHRIALRFVYMNITTQPMRMLLYLFFLLITSAGVYFFFGTLLGNWDDTYTRIENNAFFKNTDDRRLIVKKQDGSSIQEEDIELFESIQHVVTVDGYDYVNDINYYINFGTDYNFIYSNSESGRSAGKVSMDFRDRTHFMKSATGITEKELVAGRLPKERNEVVLYSEDLNVIGMEKPCYFTNTNMWGYDQYYMTEVTVVGLLKEESSQVYFSEELSHMLSLAMYEDHYSLEACLDFLTGKYMVTKGIVPVIGDSLMDGELRVSRNISSQSENYPGQSRLTVFFDTDQYGISSSRSIEATILEDFNEHSALFVEISKDLFYELYQQECDQASVYIKDYIHTDYVLKHLSDLGYDAISAYRISRMEYDGYKSMERVTAILKASAAIAIIALLELFILKSILKLRNKDFMVLGSMGMERKVIVCINYYEMFLYLIAALLISISATEILGLLNKGFMEAFVKYYNVGTYSIYIMINLFMLFVTVWSYNRYLSRRQKWSME